MKSGSTLTYLHGDHLGSTALATTSGGAWQSQEKYFAYGKDRDTANSVPTDHKFTGQKQDDSGLMYYSSRYYDPQIGLFVSPDTIVPDARSVFGYNRSMYSFGNPLKFVDPSGHDPCDNGSKNCDPLWLEYTQGLAQSGCGVGNCGISFSNYMAAQEQYQAYLANEGQYDADLGIINGDLPGDAQAAGQRNQYYEVYKQYFLPSHLELGTDLNSQILIETMQGSTMLIVGSWGKDVYPRGHGASTGPVPKGYVPVSRWMSADEAQLWIEDGGTSIPGGIGAGNRIYVTTAGAPKPGGTGPVRVDFYVPQSVLQIGGNANWFFIVQPASNTPIYNVSVHYPQ